MKIATFIIAVCLVPFFTQGQAVNTWTNKENFGGVGRGSAVGFSIGSKGYIGTGIDDEFLEETKDFWEYDPALDVWTQKADFGGSAREDAVGFSIGNKGYLGTGSSFFPTVYYKDFWEYDPDLNTWTQKSNFGGTARDVAIGFSIGNRGYIGTGYDGNAKKDFWEYDPVLDTWTQKLDFAGGFRTGAVGFGTANKGYVGTGYLGDTNYQDFWEYNPVLNTWVQKANFGGGTRYDAVGFSIGSKGYIGTGSASNFFPSWTKDFWEYNVETNTWTKKANFGGTVRDNAVGFSIGTSGYIGTGYASGGIFRNDFWEYHTQCNAFTAYPDADHDGYGDAANPYIASDCILPQGFVLNSDDCNDASITVFPGAAENCNAIDDDCDGQTDENCIPINLVSSNITSNSVQLDWSFAPCALSYKVIYRIKNSGAPWTNVSAPFNTLLLTGLAAGTTYSWEVKSKCGVNPSVVSDWSVKEHFTTAPLKIDAGSLATALIIYPNPVKQSVSLQLTIGSEQLVNISVYDVSGKEMLTWFDGEMIAGDHKLSFDVSSFVKGIYFVRMIAEDELQNQKLIIQ